MILFEGKMAPSSRNKRYNVQEGGTRRDVLAE